MNDLTPIIEQARAFLGQGLPEGMLENTAAIAIAVLVGGIGLSVLGAKLAKPALTTALGLLGAAGGVAFARAAGFLEMPGPVIGGAVGAVMFGIIAHLTFRIWVGAITAIVLAALALGTFGYERVIPHLAEFDETISLSQVAGVGGLSVPSPEEQQAYGDGDFRQWAQEFWAFATGKDATLHINAQLVGFGALAAGLFLGVLAVRWMLILSMSVVGTILVTWGVATLLTQCIPGSYQALVNRPGVVGMGMGAFLVTSLILQTLLTRKAPAAREESNPKS